MISPTTHPPTHSHQPTNKQTPGPTTAPPPSPPDPSAASSPPPRASRPGPQIKPPRHPRHRRRCRRLPQGVGRWRRCVVCGGHVSLIARLVVGGSTGLLWSRDEQRPRSTLTGMGLRWEGYDGRGGICVGPVTSVAWGAGRL